MSKEAQNGNFAKPMLGVVLNETELENDYPVYINHQRKHRSLYL